MVSTHSRWLRKVTVVFLRTRCRQSFSTCI